MSNLEMLLGRFDGLIQTAKDVKKLEQAILQWAIQGKLVLQESEEISVASTIVKAANKRNEMVKAKLLRKRKPLLPLEDSPPFSLPNNWIYCRLGSCLELINGRAYKRHELLDAGTPVIRIQNLNGGNNWFYSDLELGDEKYCDNGDLLFAWSGTFGPYFWTGERAIYHYHIWKIGLTPALDKRFAYYLLKSLVGEAKGKSHGVMLLHITKTGMENLAVAIPPLAEQKRIVAKVDALFEETRALAARLEAANEVRGRLQRAAVGRLTEAPSPSPSHREGNEESAWGMVARVFDDVHTSPAHIETLKQTILQLAVMGRLVPQDPNDKPAQFYQLGEIVSASGGNTPSRRQSEFWDGDVAWFCPKDMKSWFLTDSIEHLTDFAVESGKAKMKSRGAVLIVVRGMILAHTVPAGVLMKDAAINQDIKALEFDIETILAEFLCTTIWGLQSRLLSLVKRSTHGTCKLQTDDLMSLLVRVPSLREQRKILVKVDELLAMCDQLAAGLEQVEQVRGRLLDAVLG